MIYGLIVTPRGPLPPPAPPATQSFPRRRRPCSRPTGVGRPAISRASAGAQFLGLPGIHCAVDLHRQILPLIGILGCAEIHVPGVVIGLPDQAFLRISSSATHGEAKHAGIIGVNRSEIPQVLIAPPGAGTGNRRQTVQSTGPGVVKGLFLLPQRVGPALALEAPPIVLRPLLAQLGEVTTPGKYLAVPGG